ncbi:hypothetical protein KAJ38_02970 [Candidatus Pacearchaeota archaeon]|nr:hypothetical protein [Candidatus Pacearchaeota archaeon]
MDWKTILKVSIPSGIGGVLFYLLYGFIFIPSSLTAIGHAVIAMGFLIILVGFISGIVTYKKVEKSKVASTIISILITILILISPVIIVSNFGKYFRLMFG